MPLPAQKKPEAEEAPPSEPPVALELGALYRAHAQTVARWALRLGGPGVDAEDVVQEVFLIAHRLLPEFRGEARVTTWLFRITHNVVRHRRRRERVRRLFSGGGGDEAARRVASLRPTPVEDLERIEAQRAVYGILDSMTDKYRTVFVLFELESLSGEEVAALTGQRLGTIWVWLHRARAQFVKELGKRDRKERP